MRRCQCNELLLVSGYCDVCPFCDTSIKPVTIISIKYVPLSLLYHCYTKVYYLSGRTYLINMKDSMNLNLIFQVLLFERNFELLI